MRHAAEAGAEEEPPTWSGVGREPPKLDDGDVDVAEDAADAIEDERDKASASFAAEFTSTSNAPVSSSAHAPDGTSVGNGGCAIVARSAMPSEKKRNA